MSNWGSYGTSNNTWAWAYNTMSVSYPSNTQAQITVNGATTSGDNPGGTPSAHRLAQYGCRVTISCSAGSDTYSATGVYNYGEIVANVSHTWLVGRPSYGSQAATYIGTTQVWGETVNGYGGSHISVSNSNSVNVSANPVSPVQLPDPVSNIHVTSYNASTKKLTIAWTNATNSGTKAVTKIKISKYSPDNNIDWTYEPEQSASTTSYTYSSIEPNSLWTFAVFPYNSAGEAQHENCQYVTTPTDARWTNTTNPFTILRWGAGDAYELRTNIMHSSKYGLDSVTYQLKSDDGDSSFPVSVGTASNTGLSILVSDSDTVRLTSSSTITAFKKWCKNVYEGNGSKYYLSAVPKALQYSGTYPGSNYISTTQDLTELKAYGTSVNKIEQPMGFVLLPDDKTSADASIWINTLSKNIKFIIEDTANKSGVVGSSITIYSLPSSYAGTAANAASDSSAIKIASFTVSSTQIISYTVNNFIYDGKQILISATMPSGYTLDTSSSSSDVDYKAESNPILIKQADITKYNNFYIELKKSS